MSDATDRLKRHVASYNNPSAHRKNCTDVCHEHNLLSQAIYEIAKQKMCVEMESPDDGDYQHAYETIVRNARGAWEEVQGTRVNPEADCDCEPMKEFNCIDSFCPRQLGAMEARPATPEQLADWDCGCIDGAEDRCVSIMCPRK
jgi:hypothetical protein